MNSSKFDDCPKPLQDISKQIYKHIYLLIFSSISNAILALTATLGNGLVIITILRSQNLQTPSYLLITSLAFTDLFIGLVYHPVFVHFSASLLVEKLPILCLSHVPHYSMIFLGAVSIIMNMFMSIDRYLALSLKHRYRIHVTKKRVRIAIVAGWVFACCFSSIASLAPRFSTAATSVNLIPASILVIITCSFYLKSFITLHSYTSQVQVQQPNPSHGSFDVVKYRKTLRAMVAILGCYLVCCVMVVLALVAMSLRDQTPLSINTMFIGFLIFGANSSLNPVIYLTRFADIRQECRNLLKKLTLLVCI